MANTSVLRCPGCREIIAVADHGETAPSRLGLSLGTDKHGHPVYWCPPCKERVVWEREKART